MRFFKSDEFLNLQSPYFWWFIVTDQELVLTKQESGPVLDSYLYSVDKTTSKKLMIIAEDRLACHWELINENLAKQSLARETQAWTIEEYIITYSWTGPLILNHSYLIGNLTVNKFKNCWTKSFRTSKNLTLLYVQFLNVLISQRDMSGARLGALPNNR